MASLEDVLRDFERRLSALEEKLGTTQPSQTKTAAPPQPAFTPKPSAAEPVPEKGTGTFFGVVGIAFLLLAAIFFLKLTIDSGWLTPERQVLLASFFGLSCLLLPHAVRHLADDYGALLSGLGAAVLHITWLGAYLLYHLIDPRSALTLASAVGALSLLLNARIGNSVFVVVSVAGTYLAAPLIGYQTRELATLSSFFLLWNVSFSALAIALKRREVVLIASYFAVLTAGFFSSLFHPLAEDTAITLLSLQGMQFLVFGLAMTTFSLFHRQPLRRDESWATGVLLLFYYGNVYSLLSVIAPGIAPWGGVILSLLVLGIYQFARAKLQSELTSTDAIATFASLVLLHSLFLKLTPDTAKPLFSLALMLLVSAGIGGQAGSFWRFPMRVALLAIGYGAILTFSGIFSPNLTLAYHFGYGFVALFLALAALHMAAEPSGSRNHVPSGALVLGFAHVEMLFGLYRLSQRVEMSGSLFVSLTWGLYALAILALAWQRRDRVVGQSAVIILAAVSLKAAFYDVLQTGSLARVLSLLASGAFLYGCGWIFQQMRSWQRKPAA